MPATHAATAWKGLPVIAPSRVAAARAGSAAGVALGTALGVALAAGIPLGATLGAGSAEGAALRAGLSGSFGEPPQPDITTRREETRNRRRESMSPCGR